MTSPPIDAEPGSPSAGSAPGSPPRRRLLLRRIAIGGAVLAAVAGVLGGLLYAKLDSNIPTDEATARALAADQGSRPDPGPNAGKAKNILLMGTDSQAGWGSTRADTTILLHLSGDGRNASMTSVPRDLMVNIPSCLRAEDDSRTRATFAQFNWAYERAGAACTIRTFEKLSGVRVDHHLVVDFSGFMKVVDAVGGVEVDVPEPIAEPEYGITLQPGRQLVKGKDALVFVRTRQGVSDGSDLQRIERQKDFLRNLTTKVTDSGTLTSPTKVYPLLDAITSSLTADSGMDSPPELYSLLKGARAVPAGALKIVTLPSTEHPDYVGRYKPVAAQAKALFKALREDRPLPGHLYNAYDKEGHRERPYFDKLKPKCGGPTLVFGQAEAVPVRGRGAPVDHPRRRKDGRHSSSLKPAVMSLAKDRLSIDLRRCADCASSTTAGWRGCRPAAPRGAPAGCISAAVGAGCRAG